MSSNFDEMEFLLKLKGGDYKREFSKYLATEFKKIEHECVNEPYLTNKQYRYLKTVISHKEIRIVDIKCEFYKIAIEQRMHQKKLWEYFQKRRGAWK